MNSGTMPAPIEEFDRSLPQLGIPAVLADELIEAGYATRGGRQEFGPIDVSQLVPVMVAVTGLTASAVTLVTQSEEALRRVAEGLARWRRKTEPEQGKTFSLLVRRGRQPVVRIELEREPDPEALLTFLQSALNTEPRASH